LPADARRRREKAWLRVGRAVVSLLLAVAVASAVLPLPGAWSEDRRGSRPPSQALWEGVLRDNAAGSDPQSLFWAAVAYANLGRIEEARQAFERLDKADPARRVAEPVKAESRRLQADNPGDLRALNGLAFLAYAEGDYETAGKQFESVVALDPQNPWPRCYWGYSLGKSGRVNEAVKGLEEGVRRFPENEVLHFLLGLAYYHQGSYVRALLQMAKAPRALRYFR
jgi:tetratricopeptide (TPR) repeat protein